MSTPPANLDGQDLLEFVSTLKEAFRHDMSRYKAFLVKLRSLFDEGYHPGIVMMMVEGFFKDYNDLFEGLCRLLGFPKSCLGQLKRRYEAVDKFVRRVEMRLVGEEHNFMLFSNMLEEFRLKKLPKKAMKAKVEMLLRDHLDLLGVFRSLMSFGGQKAENFDKDVQRDYLELEKGEDMDWNNHPDENKNNNDFQMEENLLQQDDYFETTQVHRVDRTEQFKEEDRGIDESLDNEENTELDLSNCQLCTPSYRLLPDNYPKARTSCRTKLGKYVLNDTLVSMDSGCEDGHYNLMKKNRYEELLSKCDDNRYELDMLLNVASNTIGKVENFLNKIRTDNIKTKAEFRIKDHLSAQSLRLIKGIYGKHGLEVVHFLNKKPTSTLEVILARLKQKQEEWLDCLAHFNQVWVDVHAKYHMKSLDYRAFDFKRQDRRNLSREALLAGVKDKNQKTKEKDASILASCQCSWQLRIPDMEWEYPDEEVHEDIYRIIKISSEKIGMSKVQYNGIMKIWRTFLEPLLNISRLQAHKVIKDSDNDNSGVGVSRERKNLSNPDAGTRSSRIRLSFQCTTYASPQCEDARLCKHKSASGRNTVNRICDIDPLSCQGSLAQENSSRDKLSVASGFINKNLAPLHSQISFVPCTLPTQFTELDLKESSTRAGQYHQTLNPSYEFEEGEIPPEGCELQFSMDLKVGMANEVVKGNSCTSDQCYENPKPTVFTSEIRDNDANSEDDRGQVNFISRADRDGNYSQFENYNEEAMHEEDEEEKGKDGKADDKTKAEGEIGGSANAHNINKEGTSLPLLHQYLHAKPLYEHAPKISDSTKDCDSRIFYGNGSFYVLIRLHWKLYQRLLWAKRNSFPAQKSSQSSEHLNSPEIYAKFKSTLHKLIEGSMNNSEYEDVCFSTMGLRSYVLFTLDALIHKIVQQVRAIASNEMDCKFIHEYENSRKIGTGNELICYENTLAVQDWFNLPIFRFQFTSVKPTKLAIHLIDNSDTREGTSAPVNSYFQLSHPDENKENSAFLTRNKRKISCDEELVSSGKVTEGTTMVKSLEFSISSSSSSKVQCYGHKRLLSPSKRKEGIIEERGG